MLIAGHEKGQGWVRFLHSARLRGNLLTLGQIRHATIKTNDYYPLIARAVERLDRSTGEARRAVYERARKAVAELRSNQLALLDAEITEERLALEEAIRKVEAEAARKSPTETRTEPQSAPSEGMPDGDNIQSRDHGQPASPDRDDRPPALPSRQAPIFLPTGSDDRNNTDIQAVAIGGAYGADHYHDDIPGSRWRGSLLVVMAVLALAVLAGTFAYRAMFGGSVFPALPPIIKAGTGPNNIVRNNSDIRQSNSSQTSITSAGSSEKLQPMDIREAPKAVPRVISNIPISSKPSAAAVAPLAPAPAVTAPALDRVAICRTLSRRPRLRCQYRLPRSRRDCGGRTGCARAGCAFARSCPAGAHGSICPAARLGSGASTGFLGAEGDCGGRTGCARAGCAFARSCPAGAHGSICPAARLGSAASTGFLGAERRLRRSHRLRASRCAFARSCPAGAHGSICPAARLGSAASTGFLGAEGDCGGRTGCARLSARSCPAGAHGSIRPAARLGSGASTGFLGAEGDCGGRTGCARADCAFARSCPAGAHGSIRPAARLGSGASTGFLGAEGDSQGHRRPRWVGGNGYILAARAR